MDKPKYIQDTDWWKKTRETAVKALDQQWHETMDKVIIRALGFKGKGGLRKRRNPPRGGRLL